MKIVGTQEYQEIKSNINSLQYRVHELENLVYPVQRNQTTLDKKINAIENTVHCLVNTVEVLNKKVNALYQDSIFISDAETSIEEKYEEW